MRPTSPSTPPLRTTMAAAMNSPHASAACWGNCLKNTARRSNLRNSKIRPRARLPPGWDSAFPALSRGSSAGVNSSRKCCFPVAMWSWIVGGEYSTTSRAETMRPAAAARMPAGDLVCGKDASCGAWRKISDGRGQRRTEVRAPSSVSLVDPLWLRLVRLRQWRCWAWRPNIM